jgi:hypothetical protein
MGKLYTSGDDRAYAALAGTFTATGQSAAVNLGRYFNLSLWGTFSAVVSLERSFDGGTTWLNCTRADGTANSFSAAASLVCEEPEAGVLYRLNCTTYTSGTVSWRLSQ